jgi:hypothetical protein
MRFALTFCAGLIAALIPVFVELAVDLAYSWRAELSRDALGWYAVGALALMVTGAGTMVVTLGWFAHGEPTRQFPGAKSTIDARSV